MELILLCVIILLVGLSAYLFGRNGVLRDFNSTLKTDRDMWIDKATVKQGIGLLGQERKTAPTPKNHNPQPVVVMRGELEQRAAEKSAEKARTSPIDTSVKSVRSTVEKAREILDAGR